METYYCETLNRDVVINQDGIVFEDGYEWGEGYEDYEALKQDIIEDCQAQGGCCGYNSPT